MGKSAILAIKIIGDATSSVAAMTKAQRAAETFKDKLGRASTVAKVGFAAITAGAVVCAKSAADLQQSVGGVETVFGSSSQKMLQWSQKAAQAAGLSQNSYNEMATIIGSQLQNMGMAQDQSAEKTNQLIGLGADLSSMFGGTTSDAVDALSSALKGEMDPIEKYGISLNDATLKAQAQKMGLGQLYAAGDKNAKMQATLAAVTAQSGKAQGNFAKEADTAQGQQARMSAELENAKAKLGAGLLPALTTGVQLLATFANWVQQNTSWLGPLVVVIGGIAAAIIVLNTAWGIYSAVQAVVATTTITTAGAFGILAGATGIGLLIAIVTLLIMNWNRLPAFFQGIWAGIQNIFWTVVGAISGFLQSNFGQAILVVFMPFIGIPNLIVQHWGQIVGFFRGIVSSVIGFFQSIPGRIQGFFNSAYNFATGAWNGAVSKFYGIKSGIVGVFTSIGSAISAPFKAAFGAIKSLWNSTVGGFGFDIPSWIPGIGGKSFKIPMLASGGILSTAGTVMVGELGPELLTLPAGAQVTPLNRAAYHFGDSGQPVVYNYNIEIRGEVLDADGTAATIKSMLVDYDRKRGN